MPQYVWTYQTIPTPKGRVTNHVISVLLVTDSFPGCAVIAALKLPVTKNTPHVIQVVWQRHYNVPNNYIDPNIQWAKRQAFELKEFLNNRQYFADSHPAQKWQMLNKWTYANEVDL